MFYHADVWLQRIQYLKDIEWIDPQTRAVFVEFNLYNSAVNLFAVSYILFEFLPTGCECALDNY